MSQTHELRDDDFEFEEDAPPGFYSQAARQQLLTGVGVTTALCVALQIVLPQLVMPIMMSSTGPSPFSMTVEAVQPQAAVWWNGRLWVGVNQMGPGAPTQTVLRAIDDAGQFDRKSDLVIPGGVEAIVRDDSRLWLVSANTVSEVEGRTVRTIYPKRALSGPLRPFVHEGQLSLFERQTSGQFQWLEFRDGDWTTRGALEVPDALVVPNQPGTTASMPQARLRTGWSNASSAGPFDPAELYPVTTPDGRLWLFAQRSSLFEPTTANRSDPPTHWLASAPRVAAASTATDEIEPVSALALNQALPPGWTMIGHEWQPTWLAAAIDGQPQLLSFASNQSFPMKSFGIQDGTLKLQHSSDPILSASTVTAIAKPDGSALFVADSRIAPSMVVLLTLTSDGFGPVRRVGQTLIGFDPSQRGFWSWYIAASCIPVVLTLALLAVTQWFYLRCRVRRYGFGHHTVRLATVARRGVARGIDVVLFGAPMWGVMLYLWLTQDLVAVFEQLLNDPRRIVVYIGGFVLAMLLYVVFAALSFGFAEGVWGTSPGKWICRLKVIRTTLEPMGFFRGIVRQLLLMIDGQLNYAVALAMAACLSKSQRLGDLAADSIVVDVDSLPPNWPHHNR